MAFDLEAMDVMQRMRFHQAFQMLKSACDAVALKPSKESCQDLVKVLQQVQPDLLDHFNDYVCFPIFIHLSNKNHLKKDVICHVLEALHAALDKLTIKEASEFWKIFTLIILQIDDDVKNEASETSEEFKLMVVKCLHTLLKKSPKSVLDQVYSREYYSKISVAIYTCIQFAKKEKFITLRLEALECILTFIQDVRFESAQFKEKVANIVMLMVPGIMSVSLDVVSSSDIQNHKLILLAIRIWGRTTGLVMEDIKRKADVPKVFKINAISENDRVKLGASEDISMIIKNQKRDENWLKSTGKKLTRVVAVMVQQVQHENYKIRKQLAIEIDFILSQASRSMVSSLGFLIDALIILSQDEHAEVVKTSHRAIEKFSKKCDSSSEKKLGEVVEECLYALITKLPRILRGVDLSLKENHLQLLSGYFDILGTKQIQKVTNSSQHLSRLLKGLQIAATLDCNMVSLLEEMSIREVDQESTMCRSVWKQFRFLGTPKSQSCLENVCKKLSQRADISVLIHNLMDDFNTSVQYRKEITLIINYMLSTDSPGEHSDKECLLRTALITIMEPLLAWKLPVYVGKDGAETRAEAQANVIQTCLLTECVATIAFALGKDVFSPLILRCLYPMLESAGSPLFAISVAGLESVNRIANLYGGGVGDLVAQNVDYLSHHVTVNLKYVEKNPKVLSVLSVIMKHSTMDVLPSLYDIVNDVLVQSCDTFQEVNGLAFLHVFLTFVSCLLVWLKEKTPEVIKIEKIKAKKSIYEELKEFHRASIDADSWMTPDESKPEPMEEINPEEIEQTEEKAESPDYVKFTIEILKRSLHFLPSKETSHQIIVLQILEKGVLILAPYEDDLLPITYKIWSPLVSRFDSRNSPMIIHRAFVLLTTLGLTSKDFVRSQTLKEVMPSLCRVLISSSKKSQKELSTGSYVISQQYKLQLALLKGIARLCVDMDVIGKEIEDVLYALDPYLSQLQPKALQEACLSSYLEISLKESNTVWVHLMSLKSNNDEIKAPHENLISFKIKGRTTELLDFQKNIDYLLEKLD